MLAGDRRVDDLDRLYLGLRSRAGGFETVREVGDFVAHRDVRKKGLVTQVGRDVYTSAEIWSMGFRGLTPSSSDLGRAADANLRLATDDQILAGCGCGRVQARKRVDSAMRRINRGERISSTEAQTLTYLGNRFIWRPAFCADQLVDELGRLMIQAKLIRPADLSQLAEGRAFVALHALAVMHGSAITLNSGSTARLFAGYGNKERLLEVKMDIVFPELGKPLKMPICLFLTDLNPENHCAPSLLSAAPVPFDFWTDPVEVGLDGRVAPIV